MWKMIELLIQIILLVVGFAILIKGSDIFVSGSSNIATILKIPTLVVGLTIVAFGTSAPEAAVSISASIQGSNALAVSNIVGSNIFNILGIIGICALLKELKLGENVLDKDIPSLLIVTLLVVGFILLSWNITRIEGIILLLLIIGYTAHLVYTSKKSKGADFVEKPKFGMLRSIVYVIIGLVAIILGAQLVVNSSSYIAMACGMSETLVGLTIVAIGTSLPELVTSLTALKRDENQLVIGNVIGSNIFNILFVLGLSSAITPISVSSNMIIDLGLMIFVTILCFIFGKTHNKFDRKEGIILLGLFILYMAFVILRN